MSGAGVPTQGRVHSDVPVDTVFPSIPTHKYFLSHEYEGIGFNTIVFCQLKWYIYQKFSGCIGG